MFQKEYILVGYLLLSHVHCSPVSARLPVMSLFYAFLVDLMNGIEERRV